MRTKLGVLVAGFGFLCLTVPVVAHHSFDTEYDGTKKVKLTGVVTNVSWMNPHMRVYIDVTDAGGKVTNWNMELTSPNSVQRQGWGRNDLVPGEKVISKGTRAKSWKAEARSCRSPRSTRPTARCSSRADRRGEQTPVNDLSYPRATCKVQSGK
jgi:hypothetical protein